MKNTLEAAMLEAAALEDAEPRGSAPLARGVPRRTGIHPENGVAEHGERARLAVLRGSTTLRRAHG